MPTGPRCVEQAAINPVYANVTAPGDSAPAAMQDAMITTARLIGVMTGGSTSTRCPGADAWQRPVRAPCCCRGGRREVERQARWIAHRKMASSATVSGQQGTLGESRRGRSGAAAARHVARPAAQWWRLTSPARPTCRRRRWPRAVWHRRPSRRFVVRGNQASAGTGGELQEVR